MFDQDHLDHPRVQEALFITDTADLIAIDNERNFQVLTQTDLANCVQRNHVYLCDKQHVVQHDLTDTCLGSLYLRMEDGVRQHCKFERKPVQEMVYQLTATEHLIYSPIMQTSTIICKNATSETIHLDIATKIHVPENCQVKFAKHTITSTFTSKISSPPLQFAWAWDPFTLPSTSLDNPQHLDHMVNELRNKIYNMQTNLTSPEIFENMLVNSTFSLNSTAIVIWLTLALASILYLILFLISLAMYIRHRRNINPLAKHNNPTPNHTYDPLPTQPLAIQNQNQILLQELGNVLIQHHTTQRQPTQIRLNP